MLADIVTHPVAAKHATPVAATFNTSMAASPGQVSLTIRGGVRI
jgi:hypothetical protein